MLDRGDVRFHIRDISLDPGHLPAQFGAVCAALLLPLKDLVDFCMEVHGLLVSMVKPIMDLINFGFHYGNSFGFRPRHCQHPCFTPNSL